MKNAIDLNSPLPGIYDTLSRLLIEELAKRICPFRFKTRDEWIIDVFALRPASRVLGYRVGQIGFIDDEVWLFVSLDGDANFRRYGREDAQAVYNLSDPKNSIEEVADGMAGLLKEADKDDDTTCS